MSNSVRLCCMVSAVLILQSVAMGQVIEDDAKIGNDGLNDVFYLSQSIPDGDGLFAIYINHTGGSLYDLSYAGIAEEYALFSAYSGLEFTPEFVAENTPLVSNNGVDPGSATVNLSTASYFAYWDDRNFDSIADSGDNYGWVNLGAGPTINEGATALGGGIIVGTLTQIPEPGMLTLLTFGGLAMLRRRGPA